jgi:hypothetical protein
LNLNQQFHSAVYRLAGHIFHLIDSALQQPQSSAATYQPLVIDSNIVGDRLEQKKKFSYR